MRKLNAALLSALVPGLGQAYVGDTRRAAAILAMSVPVLVGAVVMRAWMGSDLAAIVSSLGLPYLLILVPSVRDAWCRAGDSRPELAAADSRSYVLAMLACVGPMALPLLWQSPRFGRAAKVAWSLAVIAVVAVAVWVFVTAGPLIREIFHDVEELRLS